MSKNIIDYSKICDKIYDNKERKNHFCYFPHNVFMIIAGSTGCGKTNLMLNFLLNNFLDYNDVIIYTPTRHQKYYRLLDDYFHELKYKYNIGNVLTFYNVEDEIIDPVKLDPSKTHIVIFDDVMTENQKTMTDYFCRSRHSNANVFYLCQSIHLLKKHGIRQNANIFILFHQDDKTLKYFYETHISGDMSFEEFKEFCQDAWSTVHGFVVINIWEKAEFGRYMENYKTVYIPKKYLIIAKNT